MSSTEIQSTTDLPSGDPVPAGPSPPPAPKPFPLKALLAAAPSNIDAFLAHLQRALSTPSGIDTVLLFLCYSSRLSSAALELLTRPVIQRSAKQLLALASALPPSTTLIFNNKVFPSPSAAILLSLSKRLKAFSALLSDTRTFLRLWGLLGMYFWGRGLFLRLREARLASASASGDEKSAARASIDKLEASIAFTQLAACVVFQALENGAYLASKGVLEWQPATIGKAYRWSARFWGCFVVLKLTELFRDRLKRSQVPKRQRMGDKTVAVFEREEREWNEEWRKLVGRNMAWFPLTLHWSLEQGLFSEFTVGAVACIPGIIQIRDLWKRTAE